MRLATHYIFIFISLVATSSLYVAIFIHFRRQSRLKETVPNLQMNRTPTFLVYAVIYLACTLPLAIGRITAMAHKHVSTSYYCFAGSMIAANGLFDCIIFGSTRHSIVFGSINDVDTKNTGLETFSFMRTPARDLGNEVWIQGGKGKSRSDLSAGVGGWWPSLGKRNSKGPVASRIRERNLSQESLRGEEHNDMAIHMDVVTSMTVEERARYPGHSSSEAPSVTSMESTFPKAKGV